jgi:hypothetical protein
MSDLKLSTPVKIYPNDYNFSIDATVTGIGSCFAQDILEKLFAFGFKGAQNPNGIVYNAWSIAESLKRVVAAELYTKDEFFEFDGVWHSWNHHGNFSCALLEEAVEKANSSLENFRNMLQKSDMVIITPSSSVIYEYSKEARIVANCHKVPNNEFERKCLTAEQDYQALKSSIENIFELNSKCLILFTLSPVRHYPGDLILNAKSKAHLLTAIHQCVNEFEQVSYFPSYEIVLDELRDYRFFKEDMQHPSELARKIILTRFIETFFDENTAIAITEAVKKNKAERHIKMKV